MCKSSGAFVAACKKAALGLTAACFIWAVGSIFVCNYYGYKLSLLIFAVSASLALIAAAWYFIGKHESFFIKNSRTVTLCFLCIIGIVQLAMIFPLRYTPIFDIDAIFGGAAEWTDTGGFASYSEYFSMFHNNFGGLLLLRCVFGAVRLFGITDYYLAASLFNSALSLAAMYLTGSVCFKLIGERGRVTAYFLFVISLPFYFIAPAFYTDALSMSFPILILRLYIAARGQNDKIKKLVLILLTGLAAGLGYGVKAIVIIMLAAVLIETALCGGLKRFAFAAVSAGFALLLCVRLVNGAVYAHLDRAEAERARIPILHWVMMGTAGMGTYDPEEYEFTKAFTDPAERKSAVAERLFTRLRAYDAKELAALFSGKLDIDFGDGTYGLSDCLGCPHGEDNFLHSFLLQGGSRREAYKHICTGVVIALYLLLIASCIIDVFRGGAPAAFALRLALLGLLLFLLGWEARWRYFSNYAPVFMVSAVYGLDSVARLFDKRRKKQ